MLVIILTFLSLTQNTCNLIRWEEYNIDRIVPSFSVLYCLIKKNKNKEQSISVEEKKELY